MLRVSKPEEPSNFAAEHPLVAQHLKGRLKTLENKIKRTQAEIRKKKSGTRLSDLRTVVAEYNQTLAAVHGTEGSLFLPHYRVVQDKAVTYIPQIENAKSLIQPTEKRKRPDPRFSNVHIELDTQELFTTFFDDERVPAAIQHAINLESHVGSYKVKIDAMARGMSRFEVRDVNKKVVFKMVIPLTYEYAEFVTFLAGVCIYFKYDVTLVVNQTDYNGGLVHPRRSKPSEN